MRSGPGARRAPADVAAAPRLLRRSRKLWIAAVPELAQYNDITLRSPRSPYLTPGQMGTSEFTRVIEALPTLNPDGAPLARNRTVD